MLSRKIISDFGVRVCIIEKSKSLFCHKIFLTLFNGVGLDFLTYKLNGAGTTQNYDKFICNFVLEILQ